MMLSLIHIYWCFTVENGLNQFLWARDAIGYLRLDNRLSVKTGHIHFCICGDDDAVRGRDLRRCQDVFLSTGPIGLNFYRYAHFLSLFFKAFRCHVGMCNSCWAGGYRKDTVSTRSNMLCFGLLFLSFSDLFVFSFID